MDDFETAVIYSFDPLIAEDIKQKALTYTNSVKESKDGWRYCLERLFKTNSLQVKFFCFHVFQDLILHRHASLTEDERNELKSTLINWLKLHLAKNQEDSAIKNKYAQIVVLLFKQEYPDQWPQFFQEFLSLLPIGPNVIDIFLRILKAIDEEVVSFNVHRSNSELAHNTLIKDTMREGSIKEIVSSWYDILVLYSKTNPQLVNLALQNIKNYVGWIDINLIVNDKFIPLFYELLNSKPLREEVVDCFKEIINKGMDSSAKLYLIQQLQIKNIVTFVVLDDLDFVVKIGHLVNLTGMEVLRGLEPVNHNNQSNQNNNSNVNQQNGQQQQNGSPIVNGQHQQNGHSKQSKFGETLLDEMLQLLIQFLNNEHNQVSMTVTGFSGLYITRLKNTKQLTEKQIQHITLLVQIIRNKMKYSNSYNFSHVIGDLEEQQQFLDLRKDLSNQFRNIFRICPEMVGQFVDSLITNIAQNPEKFSFSDIEVSIYLLYQMGEGITATPEETMKSFEKFFGQMVILLVSSKISTYENHQVVSLIYFETINRYAKYIPQDQNTLALVLAAFLDTRGVHHRNPIVRSKAGNLLNKLVKQLKTQLFPFINNIIESLKNHLIISYDIQKEVPFEEQLNFYESLGYLIGNANLSSQEEQNYVERILLHPYKKLEEIITKQLYKTDTKELPFYSTQLIQLISVVGTFSKGFSSTNKSNPNNPVNNDTAYKIYFTKSLQLIIQLPDLLPHNEEIKSRTFFYMHRMVECLGNDLLPLLPNLLTILLNHTNKIEHLMEFVTYTNQLMARFKEELSPIMNDLFKPIIIRIYKPIEQLTALIQQQPQPTLLQQQQQQEQQQNNLNGSGQIMVGNTGSTDEERNLLELQKSYYTFLQVVLSNSLSPILTTPQNIGLLEHVLTSITRGCTTINNDSVQKACFTLVRRLLEEYGQGGTKPIEGFAKFVYEHIVPLCISAPLSPNFNMLDINEVTKSLKLIASKYGDEFINYLVNVYLPNNLSIPPNSEVSQQMTRVLHPSIPQKDFIDFFKLFIKNFKQQQQKR